MRHVLSACFAAALLLSLPVRAMAVEQHQMEDVLKELDHARHHIDEADKAHDHGGHAGEATKLIDKAIQEVKEGIRYRNEHDKKK